MRGACVIHGAARAHHISFVVFWMNACFHLQMEREIYSQPPVLASDET
jgi:hypothetical protein